MFDAGQVPYNVFNGLNAEFSVISSPVPGATNGAIGDSDDWTSVDSRMIWMGSGLPPFEQPVLSSDLDSSNQPIMIPVVYGMPLVTGAWYVDGKYWFVGRDTFNDVYALFSCPNPGVGGNWTYQDIGNGPAGFNCKGVYYNPLNNKVFLAIQTASPASVNFYSITLSAGTPTWTGPFANFDPTVVAALGISQSFGNTNCGIIQFSNDDLGIYFQAEDATTSGTGATYYARYNSSTLAWDMPVSILGAQTGSVVPFNSFSLFLIDPVDPDLVYVFLNSFVGGFSANYIPYCKTVTRLGTVSTVFTFPTLDVTGGFGDPTFGGSLVKNSKLHVSLPIFDVGLGFPVGGDWVSDLGGTTFTGLKMPVSFLDHFGSPESLGIPWLFQNPPVPVTTVKAFAFLKGGMGGTPGAFAAT